MKKTQLFQELLEAQRNFERISLKHWILYEINTWQWWLNIVLFIVPLIIWWKLVDRKRILEITLYGSFISIMSIFLDILGSEAVWWSYPVRVNPNILRLIPIDLAVVPVGYMLVYQFFNKWRKYIIVNFILALIYSFIGEPIMVKPGLYELYLWKYIYSFPIYIVLAIIGKLLINKLLRAKSNKQSRS